MKKILIVGAGISGSILAYRFLKKNCQVSLVDSGENFSSRVAAGQINPLVFRRMTLSWRVHDFLPAASAFYGQIEQELSLIHI